MRRLIAGYAVTRQLTKILIELNSESIYWSSRAPDTGGVVESPTSRLSGSNQVALTAADFADFTAASFSERHCSVEFAIG